MASSRVFLWIGIKNGQRSSVLVIDGNQALFCTGCNYVRKVGPVKDPFGVTMTPCELTALGLENPHEVIPQQMFVCTRCKDQVDQLNDKKAQLQQEKRLLLEQVNQLNEQLTLLEEQKKKKFPMWYED